MRRYPWEPGGREPFDFGSGEIRIPRPPRRVLIGLGIIGAAILILIVASPFVTFVTDLAWYRALGLDSIYLTRLRLQTELFLGSVVISFLYLFVNARLALGPAGSRALRAVGVGRPEGRVQGWVAAAGAAVLAFFFSLGAGANWQTLALFVGATDGGVKDPVFGQDVSFYLLRLPFYEAVLAWAIALAFIGLLYAAAFHAWRLGGFETVAAGRSLGHLSALFGVLAVLLGVRRWFDQYDLLSSHNGFVWGAGFADINGRIPLAVVSALLGLVLAVVLVANWRLRRPALVAGAIGAWVVMAIISSLYPSLVQRLQVVPSEQQVETPYILREIAGTRAGYGLASVSSGQFGGGSPLTSAEVTADQATIQNLRLWDDRQLADTYNQLQTIRTYYNFPAINLDRYYINGTYQQVEIGAREVNISQLPGGQSWVNQRLKYTHGYGVAASPVSAVQGEGFPDYVVRDIPPTGSLTINRPQIYFGQITSDYVIAPSQSPEFDYPRGSSDVYGSYKGTHGVSLASGVDRALWSMRTGDLNILISDQINSKSQILYRRSISDRLNEIAPFLTFDKQPYIVVANGRLYWIADAYTTASTYPYSEQEGNGFGNLQPGVNYVRNSVKAVVDAYDGTVTFYVTTPQDPLIRAYERVFPAMFKPLSAMPPALVAHIRVPQDLFSMQADMYRTYHVSDASVFYLHEDVWSFAQEVPSPDQGPVTLTPYYVMMRLPGQPAAEYLQILPFTPNGKQNMISWLAARNDAPHYGQLISYLLPKDRVIFGPQQISQRINEDPTISKDFSLFNQTGGGSHVVQGNLLVVPIGDTFLYVEPVYLVASSGSSFETLRKVILVDSQNVAYADSLQAALAQLLGEAPPPSGTTTTTPSSPPSSQLQQLAQQLLQHYNTAQADLRNGDLAGYASEMQQVAQLAQQIGGSSSPSPSATPAASPTP